MAEEKTFRYGFIMLGFFLVMTGMFIMSVEKPQIYITFCTLGVLLVAVGITWSMCQCYPKVGSVPPPRGAGFGGLQLLWTCSHGLCLSFPIRGLGVAGDPMGKLAGAIQRGMCLFVRLVLCYTSPVMPAGCDPTPSPCCTPP